MAAMSVTPLAEVRMLAEATRAPRPFRAALESDPRPIALIAEVKRASPVKGIIRQPFDPLEVADAYVAAGVTAISVLTDERFFKGHPQYLTDISRRSDRPILRKDFLFHEYQVYEARALGSDAILLIVHGLEPNQLSELLALATQLGMDTLVEVHTLNEVEVALTAGARLIGVNNRDLDTFATRLDVAEAIIPQLPEGCVAVAESAMASREDVDRMRAAGARAVLIGTAFCREPDVAKAVTDIMPW